MKIILSILLFKLTIISIKSLYSDDFRIININEFKEVGSYLPLKSGQKFIIELEGNPSTGYSWLLENADKLNKELIEPLNLKENNSADYYSLSEAENSRFGSNGVFHFKFKAHSINSGDEVITFIYKRLWETKEDQRKSVNLKIVNTHNINDL